MLTSVTWFQFLTYTALSLAVYYLGILLFFNRKALRRLLTLGFRFSGSHEAGTLAGPVAAEEISYAATTELQVATQHVLPSLDPAKPVLPPAGPIAELIHLLQETEVLIAHAAATASTKQDFLSLLRLLVTNYPALTQTPYLQPTRQFLLAQCHDRLSFEIHPEDLPPISEQPTTDTFFNNI